MTILTAGCCCEPPPVFEACCFPDGTCSELSQADCTAAGGIPQGVGTDCATAICPPGGVICACCIPSPPNQPSTFQCVDLPPADCLAQGGTPKCNPVDGGPSPALCADLVAAGFDPCPEGCPALGDPLCSGCPTPTSVTANATVCAHAGAPCGACSCGGVSSGSPTIFGGGCGITVFFGAGGTPLPPGCPDQLIASITTLNAFCIVSPPGGTVIFDFCGSGAIVGFLPPGPHWVASAAVAITGEAPPAQAMAPFVGQCMNAANWQSYVSHSCGVNCFWWTAASGISIT